MLTLRQIQLQAANHSTNANDEGFPFAISYQVAGQWVFPARFFKSAEAAHYYLKKKLNPEIARVVTNRETGSCIAEK